MPLTQMILLLSSLNPTQIIPPVVFRNPTTVLVRWNLMDQFSRGHLQSLNSWLADSLNFPRTLVDLCQKTSRQQTSSQCSRCVAQASRFIQFKATSSNRLSVRCTNNSSRINLFSLFRLSCVYPKFLISASASRRALRKDSEGDFSCSISFYAASCRSMYDLLCLLRKHQQLALKIRLRMLWSMFRVLFRSLSPETLFLM